MLDIDQLNRVVNVQWDGNDVVSVKITVQNPCRNGVTIQTNQEIKEGGTVTNHDGFLVMLLGKDFL